MKTSYGFRRLAASTFIFVAGSRLETMAAEYAALHPTAEKGVVAHWDFDDGVGDTLTDRSGNNHHGKITGAAWTEGVKGKALRFDGVDDEVLVPFHASFNLPEYTLEAWVRTGETGHDQAILDRVNPGGDLWNYRMMIPASGNVWEGHVVPGGVMISDIRTSFHTAFANIAVGATPVPNGKWRHLVVTQKDRVIRLYVDGVQDGSKTILEDPPLSSSQGILLGNCSFSQLDFNFKGDMDEVSLYDYALSDTAIAARHKALAPGNVTRINLGMKAYFAQPGDTLWVPIYLANFGKDSLSACQFNLKLDSNVVTLLDVKTDSGLARDWDLLNWNPADKGNIPIAMAGAQHRFGYGEGELLRLKFKVRADAKPDDFSALELSDVKFDENGTILATTVPGRITAAKPKILYGDVTGNGQVDLFDAHGILLYVVHALTLPDARYPAFTLAVADVSGNGQITSYDAALVFQYSLGLRDKFPVEIRQTAKTSTRIVGLALSEPVKLEENVYRYRLQGSGLQGLLAGEFALEASAGVTEIKRVISVIGAARVAHSFDSAGRRLEVVVSTNDRLGDESVDLLEIEAVHAPELTGGGLTLVSAYLNEGTLSGPGLASMPLVKPEVVALKPPASAGHIRSGPGQIRIELPAGRPATLEAFDLRGARVYSRRYSAAPAEIALSRENLPAGMLWIRAAFPGGSWSMRLPNIRP